MPGKQIKISRKIIVVFSLVFCIFSCGKEVHSTLLKRGDWSIEKLYVLQDFSGKTSEYYLSNAGTYHFDKDDEGNFTNATDTLFSSRKFQWSSDGKTVSITYDTTTVSENWQVIKSGLNHQEWEITQNIPHENGGVSTIEKRYRKIILKK